MNRALSRWLLPLLAASLRAADPGPTQPAGAVNPPFRAAAINAPFPENVYGADHGGSTLTLNYPWVSQFGRVDHSRGVVTYFCSPFVPRNSEGVYGMDVWLEASNGNGQWSPAGLNGGLADGAGSAYQPVNTPNPGPSPAYWFRWTFDDPPLPPSTSFRVWIYVYLYNQGGGSQGNYYVGSNLGSVSTGNANDPPNVSWTPAFGPTNPATVSVGQAYSISATGTDDNGNLSAVQIWKNGQTFVSSGGGDGWSSAASADSADPAGSVVYTAQATDAAGALSPPISLTVSVAAPSPQPAVASADQTIDLGQAFVPTHSGGAGTGGWQFVIGGSTNWNGGATSDTGTQTPSGDWIAAWTASAAGTYAFWIVRDGDFNDLPSASAGPYALTVIDPNQSPAPSASDPPSVNQPPIAVSLPTLPVSGSNPDPSAPSDPATPAGPTPDNTPQIFTLTTAVATTGGASGTVTAGGAYPANTQVTVSALPIPGSNFLGWRGASSGTVNPLIFNLTANANLIAQFGPGTPLVQPPTPPPVAPPSSPPNSIARIRFNAGGLEAAVHSGKGSAPSPIWTDPSGILASPWPGFAAPLPALISVSSLTLPVVQPPSLTH